MRSQLTRHVLRRLRAHTHQGMLPLSPTTRSSIRAYPVAYRVVTPNQRRTFLGFFQKAPRILKEPDVEPGYEELLKYGAMKKDNLRPPPREELVKAFRDFFKHKKLNYRSVNSIQARVARDVLDYLSEPTGRDREFALRISDLRTAQDSLMVRPRENPRQLVELSKALFLEIRKLSTLGGPQTRAQPRLPKSGEKRSAVVDHALDTATMMRILSQYGYSIEARDHLLNFWPTLEEDPNLGYGRTKALWIPVLRGIAQEGKEKELLDFLSTLQERSGLPFGRSIHEIMATFYARRNDIEKMEDWFNKPIEPDAPAAQDDAVDDKEPTYHDFARSTSPSPSPSPTPLAYQEVFRCAIRNNHKDWALSIYEKITNDLDALSQKHYTDEAVLLIYRFAVLLLGKGPEHIEHMMMSNPDPRFKPNMNIVNELIEAAIEKDDPYMAERLTALVPKLGLEPERRFFRLQLQYRLRAGDLDGAFTAFRSLQNQEGDDDDWPLLNKLIRALCEVPAPSYQKVLDITSYLEQLTATLEPETVVSLCMAFLKNDEQYEVIDTLSLHTIHFSHEERAVVSKAFVGFCLDSANSTARVWDAYALLRQFFPDMGIEYRVSIMDTFFNRKRADMASHVFGHMRQHSNATYRPTVEIYIRCLEGIGRCPDLESLKMVHNMLKMDTTIEPTTQLYNALMIAYTSCEEHYRALDFWKEISDSIEGPSYQTLEIVFRTYENTPFGDEPAKVLWDKLQKMDIDIPKNVLTAYLGVLACHSYMGEAKKMLEEMDAEVGTRPDVLTLAVVYNALPNDDFKDDFEAWAKEEFPHVWSELAKKRRRRDAEGMRTFQVTRLWKA
ncbi:hypothetical protein BJ170DRAFT_591048 [Xylariales sp. AK1849]|nr:hypothetical protein BJ170DRAFT_591048 [Xylariales sp. AK1849]